MPGLVGLCHHLELHYALCALFQVVEFLADVLNDANGRSLSEWVAQSLDAIEATVHNAS
jgi:hypothetical protein